MLGDDGAGGFVQRAGAAVVAEAAPEGEDLSFFGLGQGLEGGKALHEARVVVDDDRDAGLLQHGLGDPNSVGIAGLPPGQFACVLIEPLQQITAKVQRVCLAPLREL